MNISNYPGRAAGVVHAIHRNFGYAELQGATTAASTRRQEATSVDRQAVATSVYSIAYRLPSVLPK